MSIVLMDMPTIAKKTEANRHLRSIEVYRFRKTEKPLREGLFIALFFLALRITSTSLLR
jgi:hypothetical protein